MTSPSAAPQRVHPRFVGRYELLVRLASGGMATVHLARARGVAGFERLFAVKLCHPHLLEDPSFVTMFLDEARLAALIRHPNVVATVDVGTEEELYMVMEYVEGGALNRLQRAARRAPEKRLPLPASMRVALDALAGLHAAHEVCSADGTPLLLVHRDLSPQNLLVGTDGLTRITDFGIARAEARLHQTTGTTLKGKVAYMSPEQLQGGEVDRRSDLFALGVVLWEMLTGRRLFVGESRGEIAHAVSDGPIPAPSMVVPGLPRTLDPVLEAVLARDPERRPGTALELSETLEATDLPVAGHREVGDLVREALAEDLGQIRAALAAEPPPDTTRGRPPSQRRLLWLAAGLSAAALVAVLLSLWPHPRKNRAATRTPGTDSTATAQPTREPASRPVSSPSAMAPTRTPDAGPAAPLDGARRVRRPRRRRGQRRGRPRPRAPRTKAETYRPDRI
jgi:serine/threonine-protein kinase